MTTLYELCCRLARKSAILPFLLLCCKAEAQIRITSPIHNQVIQRDQNGSAELSITGYHARPYDNISAILSPLAGNPHGVREYIFDRTQIGQGFLTTTIRLETGWYKLKITGTSPGRADSAVVARVGVGEVFLVAGNSNAMGIPGLGSKSASENVISFNRVNKYLNSENITVAPDMPMEAPAFEPILADHFIYPSGEAAWYWGELGDLLCKRWNTPVLFFNAAWAAANSENYRDAATGKDAYNLYVGKYWPNRQPYSNLVNTLRYHTSVTGMRAVLFSHGENDAQLGFNEDHYFNNIRTLIANSRADAGYNPAWFIARNSVSNQLPNRYLPVINAQNRLTELAEFNAFKGPVLDTIQMPRPVSGHFENVAGGIQGLTVAAAAWNRSLADPVVQGVNPYQPARQVHTGVVPASAARGARFLVPHHISGAAPAADLHVELLADSGSYVATIGTGRDANLPVTLPDNLEEGYYRLRVVATDPIMPGSVSDRFFVSATPQPTQFVREMTAQPANGSIYISWLNAFDPNLRKMILQKTTDGRQYTDLQTVENLPTTSHVYGYTDADNGENVIFYRIRLEAANGTVTYSPLATLFRDDARSLGRAFPNPVTAPFFYFRKNENTDVTCQLFDISGREHPIQVSDRESPELLVIRPVYALPAGQYVLRTTSETQATSQLIVVLYR